MPPIIARGPDGRESTAPVIPVHAPPRAELFRRVRLALAVLGHREPGEETHALLREILEGRHDG